MLRNSPKTFGVLAALVGCLMGSLSEAGEVRWNNEFKKAAEKATAENKPLMVMVSAKWCGYCQKMLQTTFRDEKLIEHINGCFIPVYLDADHNEELVEKLQIDGLPTTLIISPELKVVKRLSGYQSAGALGGEIAKVCDHAKPAQPAKPAKTFPVSHTKPLPAFDGTCLVSLRDDGRLAKGQAQWSSTYNGRPVWFASAEHKQKFDANPQAYWPVADGICLVSDRLEQTPRPGEPVLAMIYADRLWFFADETRQQEFAKNPKPYAAHAARIASRQ